MNYTKTPWNHLDKLSLAQWNIARIIGNLDDIATDYETRWGKGKLQQLANPDLLTKWERQMAKLTDAMEREHPEEVLELAIGTRKAWEILEEAALASGAVPLDPHAWETHASDGTVYQVFRSYGQARGENAITAQELVNFYHTARLKAFEKPEPVKQPKDYQVGEVSEQIPF